MKKVELVASKAGLSVEDILQKVEQYVQEMRGLVKLDGALSLVANELGVGSSLPSEFPSQLIIKIDRLVPGMRKATIQGKIVRMYGALEYVNRSGELSERVEFKIADETGQIDVIAWSKSVVDMVKRGELKEGTVVRISNARVSEKYGRVTLHLDSSSDIEILTSGYEDVKILERRPLKISEMYDKEGQEIDFEGTILSVFPTSEFTREDGSIGKRSSLIMSDEEGGTIRIVLWGNKARISDELSEGSIILLENVRVVIRDDSIELHSTPRTRFKMVKEGSGEKREVEASVLYKFPVEEVGIVKKKKFLDLLVEIDGELSILRIWDRWVELFKGEEPPFRIRVGPIYRGEDGILVLSKSGEVEILEIVNEELSPNIEKLAKKIKYKRMWIGESSDGLREFRGTITYISEVAKVSFYCPNCGSRVKPEYGRFYCPNCGEIDEAIPLLYLSFIIDDGTGIARVVAFREKAESILGMTTKDVIERSEELGEATYSIPTEHIISNLLGKEVIARGRATYLESGTVKLILDEVEEVNPKQEIKELLREIRYLWLSGRDNLENSDGRS